MQLRDKKTALLLIDIQLGFQDEDYWGGNRNNKNAEKNCAQILNRFRELQLPIFHVRHSSINPQSKLHASHTGFTFNPLVEPLDHEPVITKRVNSAFIGTDLKERLDAQSIQTLVIVGLTTNHCVSTTTRMAGNYGYDTYLIADATASFDRIGINGEKYDSEFIHLTSLANLQEEFATIMNTNQLLEIL